MISLRSSFQFVALLIALLCAAPATATNVAVKPDGATVLANESGHRNPNIDIVTRKKRHAGSLEEYFAIDDDPDQSGQSSVTIPRPLAASYWLIVEARQVLQPPAPLSHWPCAAFPTGPPQA